MSTTTIEWAERVWNFIVGCTIASTGCAGCYAVSECYRKQFHPNESVAEKFKDTVRKTAAGQLVWTGNINFSEKALLEPLKVKKASTWFVNSLSDLFHPDVSFDIVDRGMAVMAMTPHHRYLILTKRSDRMAEYFEGDWRSRVSDIINAWPEDQVGHGNEFIGDFNLMKHRFLPNVALGTSVENQDAVWRIEHLRFIPAAVRFLSCEPLVGRLDIKGFLPDLHWVIVGGGSGKENRPMHPDWVRLLRDQCAEFQHVAFFFKQWGNWAPPTIDLCSHFVAPDGKVTNAWDIDEPVVPGIAPMTKVGKKLAGRVLDGETHDGMPTWK